MENLNMNNLLNREPLVSTMQEILINFENTKHDLMTKKGIYVYGEPGSGKTTFVIEV